jgi:hypothetical protein
MTTKPPRSLSCRRGEDLLTWSDELADVICQHKMEHRRITGTCSHLYFQCRRSTTEVDEADIYNVLRLARRRNEGERGGLQRPLDL